MAPAMSTRPESYRVSPYELARKQAGWTGKIPIDRFARLSQIVKGTEWVEIELEFCLDEDKRPLLYGQVKTIAELPCQRCLQGVGVDLSASIDSRLVRSELEAQRVNPESGETRDIMIVPEDEVRVADLVEDDLLLSIPEQICPDQKFCSNAPAMEYPAAAISAGDQPVLDNPFKVLEKLKSIGDD